MDNLRYNKIKAIIANIYDCKPGKWIYVICISIFLSACSNVGGGKKLNNEQTSQKDSIELNVDVYKKIISAYLHPDTTGLNNLDSKGKALIGEMSEGLQEHVSNYNLPTEGKTNWVEKIAYSDSIIQVGLNLLDNHKMKEFHDLMYKEYLPTFYFHPATSLELDSYLVSMIIELAYKEYHNDKKKILTEERDLFNKHYTKLMMNEYIIDGHWVEDTHFIHPDHEDLINRLIEVNWELDDNSEAERLAEQWYTIVTERAPGDRDLVYKAVSLLSEAYQKSGKVGDHMELEKWLEGNK